MYPVPGLQSMLPASAVSAEGFQQTSPHLSPSVPKLRLVNKIEPTLTPRAGSNSLFHEVSGHSLGPQASNHSRTPRANANKISARSVSSIRSEDSQGGAPKQSPGRRISPRGDPRSPRGEPRGVNLASMADIKAELLGLDMRRLIREELRSVLSERHPADSGAAVHCGSDMASDLNTEYRHPIFLEDAEDMLGLHSREDDKESPDEGAQGSGSGGQRRFSQQLTGALSNNVMWMLEAAANESVTWWDRFLITLQHRLNIIGTWDTPVRTDFLSRIADSLAFDIAVHSIIVLNIAVMAFEADYNVSSRSEHHELFFRISEVFFVLFYASEFVIKFARHRWLYFFGTDCGWNWMDFIVLVFSIPFALQLDGTMDALPAKIIRMLRMTRALRVLQLVTFFKRLRALMNSLAASVSTLICSLGMLLVFLFMFSLFFVMRVGQLFKDPDAVVTSAQKDELLESFGSILLAMLTLFQACTGGRDWADDYRTLAAVGWESQMIFVSFVAFSQMALLNIVLGMFVEQAMKSMATDKLELAHRHFEEQKEFRKTIQELFHHAGMPRTQKVTLEEWRACPQKYRLYSFLDFHGFQPNEVDQYFEMLSSVADGGRVDVDSFVDGCIRMKGGASSFSVYEVLLAVAELDEKMQAHLDQARPKPERWVPVKAAVKARNRVYVKADDEQQNSVKA